jgi:putative transposase
MPDNDVSCSTSRSGNAAMVSFFSSRKTERIRGGGHRTGNKADADAFVCMGRFCNAVRRYSSFGYLSPVGFEQKEGKASVPVHGRGSRKKSFSSWRMG